MHKIFQFRKLFYKKIRNQIDSRLLNNHFDQILDYERIAIKDKIFNLTRTIHPELESDFDANVADILKKD